MFKQKPLLAERIFFLIVLAINLSLVMGYSFFPTLDGPSHLNNAGIINELIFYPDSPLSTYFMMNREPVPNWAGHFILCFFKLFLPGAIAEKLLLMGYIAGIAFSFRHLVKTAGGNILLSYIIFPFAFSFLFFLGFFNFCLALIFLFLALSFFLRSLEKPMTLKMVATLCVLSLLCYFSHIFVYGMLLLSMGLYLLTLFLRDLINNDNTLQKTTGRYLKMLLPMALASVIPLVLAVLYFSSHPVQQDNKVFIDSSELKNWIKTLRPLIALNARDEERYTHLLAYLFAILSAIALFIKIESLKVEGETMFSKSLSFIRSFVTSADAWLVIAAAFLALYFILPDSDGTAGYVSIRLALLFFIFLTLWLSTQRFPRWLSLIALVVIIYCNLKLLSVHRSQYDAIAPFAGECAEAGKKIEANSVVLPLNYMDNWFVGHFSNYLASDKPMLILENYECNAGYFPVKWNEKSFPKLVLGSMENGPWKSNPAGAAKEIDYVFIMGDIEAHTDTISRQISAMLKQHYRMEHHSDKLRLYKKN
jgi:hypothetical protein